MKSQPTMAAPHARGPPPRSWRWPFSHMRQALVRLVIQADAVSTVVADRDRSRTPAHPAGPAMQRAVRRAGLGIVVGDDLVAGVDRGVGVHPGQAVGDGGDDGGAHRRAHQGSREAALARHDVAQRAGGWPGAR